MAVVPVIVGFGNSNWDGVGLLSAVPVADFSRWTGSALPTSDFPFDASAPGVRVFTPRLPFAAATTRNVTAAAAATVTMESAVAGTTVDQWIYVLENSTGQGQHRQISANPATATPTVTPAWSPAIAANGQVQVLASSHTAAAAGTTTVINKSASTSAFVAGDVGKWLVVLSGAAIGQARKISVFNSATQVTLEAALSVALTAGDGIRVMSGSAAVEGITSLTSTNSAIRDLTFYYDSARSYSTGFEYPNHRQLPQPGPATHAANQAVNIIPELSWQFRSRFDQKIHVVSVAAAASSLAPQKLASSLFTGSYSWLHDLTHLDYHPASPTGLYQVLRQSIIAMCELIVAEGNEPDVVGFFSVITGIDANDEPSSLAFEGNLSTLRDNLRNLVYDLGYAKKKPHLIPFITADLGVTVFSYYATTNQALANMAAKDSRTAIVQSSAASGVAYVDTTHYSAPGTIEMGKRFYAAWKAIDDKDNYAKRALADLPTLSSLRTQVRRRYERSTTSNDNPSQQIDTFLNDSINEIAHTLGDNAWFWRRAEPATIEAGIFPATVSIEANAARVLRIESAACPGRPITWKGIAYTSNLRLQITLHEAGSGPYIVHFIQLPKTLVSDDDVVVLPAQYVELVVVLTCKRLSECVGNSNLAMYYGSETERLWRYVKRDCLRYDRMRQEAMTTSGAYDTLRNGSSNPSSWYL